MHPGFAAFRSVLKATTAALFVALLGLLAAPALATNLKVEKLPVDGSIAGGGNATFTIILSNPDDPPTLPAYSVELVDVLPGAGVVNWKITSETGRFGCGIEGDFVAGDATALQTLICDPGTILPGQAETVVVSGKTPIACLLLESTATATSVDIEGIPYPDVQAGGSIAVTTDLCRPLFVIGDLQSHLVGDVVNFWGAQWWKYNPMTGPIDKGAASFKGYLSASGLLCGPGATWEGRVGNSAHPPAEIPTDVMIAVTDTVQKDGPNITGNILKILLVHSDGGYGPNPGHAGNGTVTEVLCPAP